MYKLKLFFSLFLFPFFLVSAENFPPEGSYTVSGHLNDASTGEALIAASVYVKGQPVGAVTNSYGFYSLTLSEGTYTIGFSYIGYLTVEKQVKLDKNITLDVDLEEEPRRLEEVVVTSRSRNNNVTSLETGTSKLSIQSIRKIPAFMGEVDVIKAIQLLPGVQASSEGASGFSVRGGSIDQNLILLDEATVYNASHLMGFFSVFNNDAIKDVKLYKGDIPASSGGRLSSLLDVRMKEGNMKRFSATGGIGTISSRLTIEAPIIKDKTSFLLAGRRTYADLFLPLAPNEDIRDNSLYFYDLNAKVNHIFNENNRLFISGYFGRDIFKNQFAGMNFGNQTFTVRWNHLFSPKLFSNITLVHSIYDYSLGTPSGQPNGFEWNSDLKDQALKADFTYFVKPDFNFKFGLHTTYHRFNPGLAKGVGEETLFTEFKLPDNFALEHGVYVMIENQLLPKLGIKGGLRLSGFQNFGKATLYNFNDQYEVIDSTIYSKGELFNTYAGLEPRLGLNYTINERNSIKSSYARTRQYVQLAQNSTAGTPLDIWFPASPNVKPQISDQISIGYFRNLRNNTIELSLETYYKKMLNTIDFKDHAVLLLNPLLEGEIRTGISWSYGIELLARITERKINGWISYTYAKTQREIKEINNGDPYSAPYDKPHDISVVLNYDITPRIQVGMNWVYSTGLPATFPTQRMNILGSIAPVYSERNAYRYPDYHRMDISINIAGKKKKGRKWEDEWNLSIYNAYARKNAWAINFVQDEANPDIVHAEKTYLFSILPALTYNFKF